MSGAANFTIREARAADAAIIGWHRARMFQDMGDVPNEQFETLRAASEEWTARAFETGEYVGWLAAPADDAERVIAGAGVHIRHVAPHPLKRSNGTITMSANSRHALVINVFTEPEWRCRGAATVLMERLLDWARAERIVRVVLHASPYGRPVYERSGFVPTNEMRYGGDL